MYKLSPRTKKILGYILGVWVFCCAVFLGLRYALPYSIPDIPESSVYLDRSGKEIAEVAFESKVRHRSLTFDEIPEFYKRSLVALEDRSFWHNTGISGRGIIRSMIANIASGKVVQWGSTITSQLVRNIEGTNKSRSIFQKVLEFAYAIRLTGKYSKETILTDYINRVAYGRLTYGLASAAKAYFAKDIANLTKAEQIALLILPQNPRAFDPVNEPAAFRERFEGVVDILESQAIIDPTEKASILEEQLSYKKSPNALPYVVDFLTASDAPTGRTSFDIDLTKHVDTLAKSVLTEIGWKNVTDYSIIIADRATNELRVMIGGASYANSQNGQVNAALTPRQVGSTLKPFIYLLAVRDLGIKPNDTVLDLPVSYKTVDDYSYEPKNYSKDFKWAITYAQALAESINIPAVTTLEQLGVQKLMDFLATLGVSSLTDTAEHYGLSLALWSGEISLYELMRAYSVFSNAGSYCEFIITPGNPQKCEKRVDPTYTKMLEDILTSREDKMRSFPIGSALDFPDRKVFVKTGTSRNFRDNWAVGYSDRYLIGVWSGNKNAENMKWVSGATGAGEIFGRIVRDLEPATDNIRPNVVPENPLEYVSITSPLRGSVYKIDPTRPRTSQQIKLVAQTNIVHDKAVWFIDDLPVSERFASLTPGSHSVRYELYRGAAKIAWASSNYRVDE